MHAFDGQTDGQTVVDSKTVRMLRSRTVKSKNSGEEFSILSIVCTETVSTF